MFPPIATKYLFWKVTIQWYTRLTCIGVPKNHSSSRGSYTCMLYLAFGPPVAYMRSANAATPKLAAVFSIGAAVFQKFWEGKYRQTVKLIVWPVVPPITYTKLFNITTLNCSLVSGMGMIGCQGIRPGIYACGLSLSNTRIASWPCRPRRCISLGTLSGLKNLSSNISNIKRFGNNS